MSMNGPAGKLPQLTGELVSLAAFSDEDITSRYVGWLRDPDVLRFSSQRFRRHDHDTCKQYLRSFEGTDNLFVAIRARSSGELVGTMTAYVASPHRTADLGILIGEKVYWGRGLGLDAWSTLMSFLLQARGMRKITGGALRCNLGMVRIFERSGMHLEAVRARQELFADGAQDVLYYARFGDE
jgi:[ribosomal protein S5]-alanine N-acetyltransferase